jgi:GNAT superfamily N-acetyltransferase
VDIRALDPHDVDDVTITAWHELSVELELEDIPEDRPTGVEKMLADARNTSPEKTVTRWLVMDGDKALAYAEATIRDTEDNRHLAFFWVGVRQDARRQGIGRQLARLALEVAEADGRTVLGSDTRQGSAGEGFLESLGGRNAYLARCSRVYTKELDDELLKGWVDRAAERATEYSLVSWESPTPEEHLAGYAQVLHAMNTAPLQDLDWEDEVFTPQLIPAWIRRTATRVSAGG